jgi:eukaryotic-like serine/threonine-protein kinase
LVRTAQADLTGRTLGDFEIGQCISTGGMGTVYKAFQRGMNRDVAVKVLPSELAELPVALQRFYQEARAAARLDHPNIVRAITVGEQDGLHYFAMEYVKGENLARRFKRDGPIEENEGIRIVTAVAEALAAAHARGIIHRDVKPENVLITETGQVKLADFGLVKRLDQDLGLTDTGKGLGTTNYMAPEQFKNAKHADVRCDIYGLGATLYAAVTGVVPWAGLEPFAMYKQKNAGNLPTPRKLRTQISPRIEAVILRAMHVDPAQRFPNCGQFIAELGGHPSRPVPVPVQEEPTRAAIDVTGDPLARRRAEVKEDVWYVRYFEKGRKKQLPLRSSEIRQGVKSGRLADDMRVSRSENGPWLPLSAFNEFVDLVAQLTRGAETVEMESEIHSTVAALEAGAPLRRRERNWRLLIVGGLVALAVLAGALWLLSH